MKNKLKATLAATAIVPLALLGSACTPPQEQADPAPVTQTVTEAPAAKAPITPPSTLFPPDTADGDRTPQQQAPGQSKQGPQVPKQQGPTQAPQQQVPSPEDIELAPFPAGKTSLEELTEEEYVDLIIRTAALDAGITVPIGAGLDYALAACSNFDDGATVEENVYAAYEAFSDTNLTLEDHAYLIGVSIGAVCPEYETLIPE